MAAQSTDQRYIEMNGQDVVVGPKRQTDNGQKELVRRSSFTLRYEEHKHDLQRASRKVRSR